MNQKQLYFQIGTNNGKDLFRKLCLKNKPDTIILVEPNISLIPQIKRNYRTLLKNVKIYNNSNINQFILYKFCSL